MRARRSINGTSDAFIRSLQHSFNEERRQRGIKRLLSFSDVVDILTVSIQRKPEIIRNPEIIRLPNTNGRGAFKIK